MRARKNQPGQNTVAVDFDPPSGKFVATRTGGPTVFTASEVAKILRLGKLSVYQAIGNGEIPCIRIGRRILIPRHALELLLQNIRPTRKPAA